ncbi:MAG TPA: hypothetical protein VMS89_07355 [Methanoregulaceae archaeon]|nr:hypothetical protein [Methanoregulaceae archaeon]
MITEGDKKGPIIFGMVVLVVAVAALIAYQMTGDLGIEDRYSQAVGLPVSGETATGFSLEGNPVLYLVVLGVLLIVCFVAYRRFMAKPD